MNITWGVHAGSWRVKCQTVLCESLRDLANLRVTHETLCLEDYKCDLSSSLPYYIYPYYPQNCNGAIQKKTLERFLQQTLLLRESYTSLSENSFVASSPLSPIVIPWEEICTQTQLTPIQSIESVLELRKYLRFAKRSRWVLLDVIGRYCGI